MSPLASFVARQGGKSAYIACVNCEERSWGFLVGYSKEQLNNDPSEISLFSLLTSCVPLLVENARLRSGTTFRFSEAMSIEIVNKALVENKSLEAILALIIDEAVRLLHAKDGLILLLEDGGKWFQVVERTGDDVASLERGRGRLSVKNSLNGLVVETGEPLISQDAQMDPRADQERAVGLKVRSVVIAPLKIRERTIGTIAVHNKRNDPFDQIDLNVLCSFANQAAIAIDNAQLYKELLMTRDEIQHKAQELQELLVQTINIQEDERHRIAADIHDRVVSQIVGALYEVEACVQLYRQSKDLDGQLQLLKQLLNEAIEQTRRSIYNIWPAALDQMSLIPALHELFKHQETITGLRHTIQVHGTPYQLRPTAQIAVYRIVQEAITNAFQHAEATSIDMSIHFSPQQLSIKISDDGEGFDVQQVMQMPLACHYGLIGMRERAQSVGGYLVVKSDPGKGSQVTLEIPGKEAVQVEGLQEHIANPCVDR
ncbi:MAG TPA: GAF domain-containing sensor histidine kinase [Anaerolineaceae bacterium]|nr:GAF domain-containing sensor histidine kinase [Anaerolineaceae bacterium]